MTKNGRNEENLKDLFEKFLNAEEADKAVEDIRKAERILREHPAPAPDDELTADIKSEIAANLLHRRTNVFRRVAYKTAIAAAAVILLAVISVRLVEKGGGEPKRRLDGWTARRLEGKLAEKGSSESQMVSHASEIAEVIWESDDVSADDADLAVLTAEIEQAEREVLALQLGENGGNEHEAVVELEMELIEINSDFWKG